VNETLAAAATKPYGFMKFNPSAGVGGHCIPVDPTYLAQTAEINGVAANFIRLANEVNLSMPSYIVNRIMEDTGSNLQNKNILILGVAYKPNVADTRETPAEEVIRILRENGANVSWNDDLVKNWNNEASSQVNYSDVTIVITRHEYMSADFILNSSGYIFDTTGSVPGARHL
jgi:UDP-N-acetyl-D-glucosamine dehydrogenase